MKLKHLWKAAGLVALSAILILTSAGGRSPGPSPHLCRITQFVERLSDKALRSPWFWTEGLCLYRMRDLFGTAGPLAHAGRTGRSGPVAVQQAGGGP